MGKCKLKKGNRIYECRYQRAVLTELVTDPEVTVQGSGSHYWHWMAKIVETGEVIEFGINEQTPQYGPRLFRKNVYEVGYGMAEPILPPFDTGESRDAEIRRVSITDDVEILGHVFHGLADIEDHVEMLLYKSFSRGQADARKPRTVCVVHVGEMWMPYPCFDAEDYANENRSYQNFIFRSRPITQEDMKSLSNLPSGSCERRVVEGMSAEMLPIVYYVGEGDAMLVAT